MSFVVPARRLLIPRKPADRAYSLASRRRRFTRVADVETINPLTDLSRTERNRPVITASKIFCRACGTFRHPRSPPPLRHLSDSHHRACDLPTPFPFRPVISFDFPHSLASAPSLCLVLPLPFGSEWHYFVPEHRCECRLVRNCSPVQYYTLAHSCTYYPPFPYASRGNLCCARIFPARARARIWNTGEARSSEWLKKREKETARKINEE